MKKRILITAIFLSMIPPVFADGDSMYSSIQESTLNLQERFYESPMSQIPNADVTQVDGMGRSLDMSKVTPQGYIPSPPSVRYSDRTMPLFKQVRIRITNHFRKKDLEEAQRLLDEEKAKNSPIEDVEVKDSNEVTLDSFVPTEEVDASLNSQEETDATSSEANISNKELLGGVKEQVTSKNVVLDADKVDFDNKTMDITATGNPTLTFPEQDVVLKANKFVYNNVSNILKAYDNVEIIKDGSSIYGDFIQVNLNEENALLDNLVTKKGALEIRAKQATSDDKSITMTDGSFSSQGDYVLRLKTAMVGGFDYSRMLIDEDDRSFISDYSGETSNLNVKVKDVVVDAKKEHNVVTAKEVEIYNGKRHLFDLAMVQAHTNKGQDYFEGNYPEIGSRNPMGLHFGPGYVFDIPNGSTLKVMPLLNYKNKFGIGGALKYKSATNVTDFMYGSANDVFVLKGKQYLDDKLYLQYGMNAFLDEWFMGARMPEYSLEAVYVDGAVIPNTFGDRLNTRFQNRFSAGYMADSKYTLRHENHQPKGEDATFRARYMAQIDQSIFNRTDKENLKMIDVSLVMQGSAAVYGTGDTQFIGRMGPKIHTQYKYWMQDIGYFAAAYHDHTPLTRYDIYRYGHHSIYLREAIRINKFLAVGWSCTANFLKEAPNGKLLQENGFIVALGPDEFKVNLGYDFIRERTYFNITMAVNMKDSNVEFKKMVIKNPDRLSSSEPALKEIPRPIDFVSVASQKKVKPMQYAEVIEIQDPDREQIQ